MRIKKIAELIDAGGRTAYENDGETNPMLFLFGDAEHGLIVAPNPRLGERPPDMFAEIIFRVGKLYPWRYIACCAETWVRAYSPEEQEAARKIRKGDLEAMSGYDPDIHTAVLTLALDVRDPGHSYSIVSKVDGERPNVTWDSVPTMGLLDGDMPDMMLRAYRASPDSGLPMPPLVLLADVMVAADLALTAALIGVVG